MERYSYFQSFENHFWQWEEQGEVISVPGGSTIAYKALLREIIPALAVQGLPPFGALLLAMIATNANGKEAIGHVQGLFALDVKTHQELGEATAFLKLLSDMPAEFKSGRKRILLFQAIFEECHYRLSVARSGEICDLLNHPSRMKKAEAKVPLHESILIKDMRVLSIAGRKLKTTEQILEKMASLPEFPDPLELPEEELPVQGATPAVDFVDQLIDNDKTHDVGSLIRHLWGGLNIPVHSSLPSSQPLGGIADLTNKGDFDKLLVSEFANDDLVFLSRLANNEALYIQREIPPHHNELERVILIDSSLKNWGTPKTLAFAVMLAIARHPKTDIGCRCFILGENYQEVSIDSLGSIIEALDLLDVGLNAVTGLTAFLKDHPPVKQNEIFLITEISTLKQPAMLKAVNEFHDLVNYWVYTDSHGNIDIYKKQQRSKRHVQHILLPLEILLKKPEGKPQNLHVTFEGEYPLLFQKPNKYELLMSADREKCFLISPDKKLFRHHGDLSASTFHVHFAKKGWELIHENLPFHGVHDMGVNEKGNSVFAMYEVHNNRGFMFNLDTREEFSFAFDLNRSAPSKLFFDEGKFRYYSYKGNWMVDPSNAAVAIDNEADPSKAGRNLLARADELDKLKYTPVERSILKNVVSVMMSANKNLVFNNHELLLNQSGYIKLSQRKNERPLATATKTGDSVFTFGDGSSIEVNRSGMFILTSSDDSIPAIFIPSVLESTLGVATAEAFAGNDYYEKNAEGQISAVKFFTDYIHPFINNVLTHGA